MNIVKELQACVLFYLVDSSWAPGPSVGEHSSSDRLSFMPVQDLYDYSHLLEAPSCFMHGRDKSWVIWP